MNNEFENRYSISLPNILGAVICQPELWANIRKYINSDLVKNSPAGFAIVEACEKAEKAGRMPTTTDILQAVEHDSSIKETAIKWAETCATLDPDALERAAQHFADECAASDFKAALLAIAAGAEGEKEYCELLGEAERIVEQARTKQVNTSTASTMSACLVAFLNDQHKETPYISTGYKCLDLSTGGLAPGDLDVISARSGVGKTDFAINIVLNVISGKVTGSQYTAAPHKVLYFSLEMGKAELMQRIVSNVAKVNSNILRNHKVRDFEPIAIATDHLQDMPLSIDDATGHTTQSIWRTIAAEKPSVVIIDNLDLVKPINPGKQQKWEQIEETVHALKQIARREECCIIMLVQMSRAVDKTKEPTLADLYGSSAIEHDASVVLQMTKAGEIIDGKGEMKLDITKVRNGTLGSICYDVNFRYHEWKEKQT